MLGVVLISVIPLFQAMFPFPFPLSVILVVVHVKTDVFKGDILIIGLVIFCVKICEAVAVHPFAPVTVTVYVPGVVTDKVALVPTTAVPLDQEYVPPPVAVKEIEVVAQVKTLVVGAVIAAVGNAVLCVMICEAVAVQPFAPVTVTV